MPAQVLLQEACLVIEHSLQNGIYVDVEVAAWVYLELPPRRLPRNCHRKLGVGVAIAFGDAYQKRYANSLGSALQVRWSTEEEARANSFRHVAPAFVKKARCVSLSESENAAASPGAPNTRR